MVDERRIFPLNSAPPRPGPLVYWMSRDQRVADNWALLHARELARRSGAPLAVCFCLASGFLGATFRHFAFMLRGLAGVEKELRALNIPFHLLTGDPGREVAAFARAQRAAALVTDADPLRIKRLWKAEVIRNVDIPVVEVDAHNVVPCRRASDKREFGAYTLRPKIRRVLHEYLTPFPRLKPCAPPAAWPAPTDWDSLLRGLKVDRAVGEAPGFTPGERAARRVLSTFLEERLAHYAERSNNPTLDGTSDLSPYLHFGQISAQRVALDVEAAALPPDARAAFMEQLIVRRELSDNYCEYSPDYDTFNGFPQWAKATLDAHRADPRPYVYTRDQFEEARTHDRLWNAAQLQMVHSGKMHNYMRMYWAKKILEWTASPEDAQAIAIHLNDRYELDGRDPNGYVGVAWSIGGVHDRAWGERPIFGKIRYMSYGGCRSKFAVEEYIRKFC